MKTLYFTFNMLRALLRRNTFMCVLLFIGTLACNLMFIYTYGAVSASNLSDGVPEFFMSYDSGELLSVDDVSSKLGDIDVGRLNQAGLAAVRNRFTGFVMQDFSLINHETALYNVMTPMLFNKTPFREMKSRAIEALSLVGMDSQAKKCVANMSGGERQRVAIARAVVNDNPILLADEPTGNLDTKNTEMIMNIFKKLNEDGKTVVIITHDSEVAEACGRAVTIKDGRIAE